MVTYKSLTQFYDSPLESIFKKSESIKFVS